MAEKITDSFIRILSERRGQPSDAALRGELILSGYIHGYPVADPITGLHDKSISVNLTTKGLLFLEELERKRDEDSLKTRALGWAKGVAIFLLGLFASDLQALGHAAVNWIIGSP